MIPDLFNKRPKTFMDYEPGKIPSKDEWETQTTSEGKTYEPFVSNIKLVGDDITKKDYDTFFEGFKSETTPIYAQSQNSSQKLEGEQQDKRKETKEKRERIENLLQNIYTANVIATTPNPLSALLRIGLGRTLEEHVKQKHYGRNQFNINLPKNKDEAIQQGWEKEMANCHQFTAEGGRNIKYISPNGKKEVIFDAAGEIVTADEDAGTYNYANPDLQPAKHFFVDMLPWLRYGNTPEDSTEWYEKVGGIFNFEK